MCLTGDILKLLLVSEGIWLVRVVDCRVVVVMCEFWMVEYTSKGRRGHELVGKCFLYCIPRQLM